MASWVSIAVTTVLSIILEFILLVVRLRGVGSPFGDRSRWWTITIIVITSAVSTAIGVILVLASGRMVAVYFGLLVPIALWLLPIRPRSQMLNTLLAPLTIPYGRLYDAIGNDMQEWCDVRLAAAAQETQWIADAAQYYYWQVVATRPKDERMQSELNEWRNSIVYKIGIVRHISVGTSPEWVLDALRRHPATSQISRYEIDDTAHLAARLEREALNELNLLLASIYRLGYRKLLIYPFVLPERDTDLPPESQPSEPEPPTYPILRELVHSLKTPIAQLGGDLEEARLRLLHESIALVEIRPDTLETMIDSVKICIDFLRTYGEVAHVSDQVDPGQVEPLATKSLIERLQKSHKLYARASGKETKLEVDIPASVPGYSDYRILALLLPLLQNAVEASPNTLISITARDDSSFIEFTIKNDVVQLNEVQQWVDAHRLGVGGKSSKPGHEGLGVSGVERLVTRYAGASTNCAIINNQFIFQIRLPRRHKHELRSYGGG